MKTLLMIILFMAGVVCQGQKIPIDIAQVIAKESIRLEKKIDALEKRLTELEKYRNLDPDSLSDPSLFPFDRIWNEDDAMGKDVDNNFFSKLGDTIENYVTPYYLFDCIIPPDEINEITVWQNGKAQTYLHKVDSITFKK